MTRRQTAVPILNRVEMLDQKIASARRITEESDNLFPRRRIDATPFEGGPHPAAFAPLFGHRGHATILKVHPIMQVEFLGVPRQRAGISELDMQAETLGQLLGSLAAQIPPLRDLIAIDRLRPGFVANLNGDRFISDPQTPLGDHDSVLILSADAGG
jgi:molybdopterin converting factor small subunit